MEKAITFQNVGVFYPKQGWSILRPKKIQEGYWALKKISHSKSIRETTWALSATMAQAKARRWH